MLERVDNFIFCVYISLIPPTPFNPIQLLTPSSISPLTWLLFPTGMPDSIIPLFSSAPLLDSHPTDPVQAPRARPSALFSGWSAAAAAAAAGRSPRRRALSAESWVRTAASDTPDGSPGNGPFGVFGFGRHGGRRRDMSPRIRDTVTWADDGGRVCGRVAYAM